MFKKGDLVRVVQVYNDGIDAKVGLKTGDIGYVEGTWRGHEHDEDPDYAVTFMRVGVRGHQMAVDQLEKVDVQEG